MTSSDVVECVRCNDVNVPRTSAKRNFSPESSGSNRYRWCPSIVSRLSRAPINVTRKPSSVKCPTIGVRKLIESISEVKPINFHSILLFVFLLSVCIASPEVDYPRTTSKSTVKIKYGTVQGLVFHLNQLGGNSSYGVRLSPIEAYLGVPYASPPTGALRFMPPVTPSHWRGIKLANQLSPLCPQRIPGSEIVMKNATEALKLMPLARFEWLRRMIPRMRNQSEDCLYLNIYTPAIDLGVIDIENDQSDSYEQWKRRKRNENGSQVSNVNEMQSTVPGMRQTSMNSRATTNQSDLQSAAPDPLSSRSEEAAVLLDGQNDFRNNDEVNNDCNDDELNDNDIVVVDYVEDGGGGGDDDDDDDSDAGGSAGQDSLSAQELNEQLAFAGEDSGRHHHRHRSVGSSEEQPTRPSRNTGNLPVLVFLTGESYDWNAGSLFDASILASFGQVVVVTLNFRLGILGFLPANFDGAVRGNYGLMDQVAALHWIQENIAQFGGSPSNVTIVGHGHGAACAHLLMLSPMAKGLFNRVILMSGSSLSPWAIARDATQYANAVGQQLNCPLRENSAMVDCLRTKSIDELLSVTYKVPDHLTAFGPIIDGIVVPSEPRILLHSFKLNQQLQQRGSSATATPSAASSASTSTWSHLHHRLHHHTAGTAWSQSKQPISYPDLLVGVTRAEMPPLFSSHEERNGITLARRDRILRTLVRNLFDYHQQAIFYTLTNEYTDWSRPGEHPLQMMDSLIEMLSDALVVAPLVETIDHHYLQSVLVGASAEAKSAKLGSKTFFYVFAYQVRNRFQERVGAAHYDELAYLFGVPLLAAKVSHRPLFRESEPYRTVKYPTLDISPNYAATIDTTTSLNTTQTEVNLSKTLITFWRQFASYGDPNVYGRLVIDSREQEKSLHQRHHHYHQQFRSHKQSRISGTYSAYHQHQLQSFGFETSTSSGQLEPVYWPPYETTNKQYLVFDSKPNIADHYHSHQLSLWLSLIPRLHIPIELQQDSKLIDESAEVDQMEMYNFEPDQYFYLRHHLLPDHENMDTYDGVVKQLSIRIPAVKLWQSTHLRQNMTSWYEQHQQLLYGRNGKDELQKSVSASDTTGIVVADPQEQFARRRIDTNLSGRAEETDQTKLEIDGVLPRNNSTNTITSTTSVLHYEAQTSDTYSTALLVTIVVGSSLLILNILIFIGVYYQLDRKADSQTDSESTDNCEASPKYIAPKRVGCQERHSKHDTSQPASPVASVSVHSVSDDTGVLHSKRQSANRFDMKSGTSTSVVMTTADRIQTLPVRQKGPGGSSTRNSSLKRVSRNKQCCVDSSPKHFQQQPITYYANGDNRTKVYNFDDHGDDSVATAASGTILWCDSGDTSSSQYVLQYHNDANSEQQQPLEPTINYSQQPQQLQSGGGGKHHDLQTTPLKSILKNSKQPTTSSGKASVANYSDSVNVLNQQPYQLSCSNVTNDFPYIQTDDPLISSAVAIDPLTTLIYTSSAATASGETETVQFICATPAHPSTSSTGNPPSAYIDGGNFVSFVPPETVAIDSEGQQMTNVDLSQLSYITLTDMYHQQSPSTNQYQYPSIEQVNQTLDSK